jgi:hypothetical protein
MGFYLQDIKPVSFAQFSDLTKYAAQEKARLTRIPVADLLHKGARFLDDHSFGTPGDCYQFNEEGLRACCQLLRLPFALVTTVEKEGLATDLLNDMLHRAETEAEFATQNLVIDQENRTAIGVVSGTYVTYENARLLRDFEQLFLQPGQSFLIPEQKTEAKTTLEYEEATVINTRLRLRVLTKIETGQVSGIFGTSPDKTLIGFQFVNSMVGDVAVRIEFFLKRLVCTNGCVTPVSHTENVVFHSGGDQSFNRRLGERFNSVLAGAKKAATMWQSLGRLRFDPHRLAELAYTSEILDIFPRERIPLREVGSKLLVPDDMPKDQRRVAREAASIAAIPDRLAVDHSAVVFRSRMRDSATLFDFINLFTEKAKTESIQDRVIIEEKAGRLATAFHRNMRKFTRKETEALDTPT